MVDPQAILETACEASRAGVCVLPTRADGSKSEVVVTLRIDTPIEVDYYRHGGILPFVLRQLLAG